MRLKRLELLGFKSFADRTVLEFDRPLVGIVGPNGCGKSNVVDAVRWVLGEQRPTSMRGGEMVDVIFKGSASRPAQNVAEATLVLDNSAEVLDDRGEEVSVTRRVYKSGEGEYLIDGERVRLKDVREMLYGTGLGSRGYSVLEQGRIDAVLSANALERRGIFEEAAGVSRYRQRKRETLLRLERVQADLLRLDDILGELERRQRSLKIQAGKAQRYVELRERWKVDGLRFARHQLAGLEEQAGRVEREISGLEANAEELRGLRSVAEEDAATREREQQALAAEVDRLAAESAELAGEVRALDERRNHLTSRVAAWRESSDEEETRATQLAVKLEERRTEELRVHAERTQLEGRAAHHEAELAELSDALAEARAAHERAREAAEGANELALSALEERTGLDNRVSHLQLSLEPLDERTERAAARLGDARGEAAGARHAEGEAAGALERVQAELVRLNQEREGLLATERERAARAAETEARRSALELEVTRLSSRVESLLDWEREREALEGGARDLLDRLEEGRGPDLGGSLQGLLADHLRAETRTARALDAVLGAWAQALVVADERDAGAILRWLKDERLGRIRVVVAGRPVPVVAPSLDASGVRGPLARFVRPDPGYEGLAERLFADVWLVDSLERAEALAREHADRRFVTEEGDLVGPTGVVGGHVEVAQGPVGRRSSAAELEDERRELAAELERVAQELVDLGQAAEETAAQRTRLEEALAVAGEERLRARGSVEAARERAASLDRSVALHEDERTRLDEERARAEASLAEARTAQATAVAALAEARGALAEAEGEQETRGDGLEQLLAREAGVRLEGMRVTEKLEAARSRGDDLERAVAETAAEVERARRRSADDAASAAAGAEEAERLIGERDALLERRGELEERLGEVRRRERAGREAAVGLRQRGDALTAELETLLARVGERQLERQRHELAFEEVARRAEEDFALERHRLLDGFEPEPELAVAEGRAALEEEVRELKRRLEQLGNVNVEAVEELEEVSQRLDFLSGQKRDLAESRRTLENTLDRLNQESERRFLETFTEVREHFQVIFRQLFGGGRADVELAEGMPVLEAGIEITARPPGRETLPITLLSGGQRTLTALALLFAIFRARPSPFCVLDEVDAALDDANIGRFLTLLTHSLDGTQFIVVTHNKGTMAACDLLYGVTMQVRGVSHVVSVELSEVDGFVPEARGAGTGDGGGASTPAEVEMASEPEPASSDDDSDLLTPHPPPGFEPAPKAESGDPLAVEAPAGR